MNESLWNCTLSNSRPEQLQVRHQLKGLARWWLKEEAYYQWNIAYDRPVLKSGKGVCPILLVRSEDMPVDSIFRKAMIYPVCWEKRASHDNRIPQELQDLADKIVAQLTSEITDLQNSDTLQKFSLDSSESRDLSQWHLVSGQKDFPDLNHLGSDQLSWDSAWAPLTASLLVAVSNEESDPTVFGSGAWNFEGNRLAAIKGTNDKIEVALEWGGKYIVVPPDPEIDINKRSSIKSVSFLGGRKTMIDTIEFYYNLLKKKPPGDATFEQCEHYYVRMPSIRKPQELQDFYLRRLKGFVVQQAKEILKQKGEPVAFDTLISWVSYGSEVIEVATETFSPKTLVLLYTHQFEKEKDDPSPKVNVVQPLQQESNENVSSELPVCQEKYRGKMKTNLACYTATYQKNGKQETITIPKSLWKYSAYDITQGPSVDLTFTNGELSEVTIPGRAQTTKSNGSGMPGTKGSHSKPVASVLGMPFHNPYTFIPFTGKKPDQIPVTYQTAEETKAPQKECFYSGTLKIKLETITPLLTQECQLTVNNEQNHVLSNAQRIGNDVILPSSGIRGFLRYLTTIVTGGPVSVFDRDAILCQRDVQLTPRKGKDLLSTPILARIKEAGNSSSSGKIVIGETKLISFEEIESLKIFNEKIERPCILGAEVTNTDTLIRILKSHSNDHGPMIKISGTPVPPPNNNKSEGLYLHDLNEITLPKEFWRDYNSRNKFGEHPILQNGDLVWVLPIHQKKNSPCSDIKSEKDIDSLHWARWGKKGHHLQELLQTALVLPEHNQHNDVSTTSIVDNLFGQIENDLNPDMMTLKGRIISDNLVFCSSGPKITNEPEPLAVMGIPHPGCAPFYYKQNTNPPELRGYKVYRVSKDDQGNEPWKFQTQGVYDKGRLTDSKQSTNRTVELLKPHMTGQLQISFKALTKKELAPLVEICKVPWRLGGGKPLGLGLCRVVSYEFLDDSGHPLKDSNGNIFDTSSTSKILKNEIIERLKFWCKTQEPVKMLRYPRAIVKDGSHNIQKMGATWFMKLAKSQYAADGTYQGVQKQYASQDVLDHDNKGCVSIKQGDTGFAIPGIPLPEFDPSDPENDVLYGYDIIFEDGRKKNIIVDGKNKKKYTSFTPYKNEE